VLRENRRDEPWQVLPLVVRGDDDERAEHGRAMASGA
jgi:hypothetical protein